MAVVLYLAAVVLLLWLKSLPMAFILKVCFFFRSNVKCSKIDFFFFTVKLGGAFLQLITTAVYESAHLNILKIITDTF